MHYAPEFEKRWNRFARPGWRRLVARDETCVKIGGRWPPDGRTSIAPWMPGGKTVDFRLSAKRDAAAAKAFFRKAFKTHGRVPRTMRLITLLALAIGNLRFANHPTVV
jgi:transposase-like protein